jgi:hypothetical protein
MTLHLVKMNHELGNKKIFRFANEEKKTTFQQAGIKLTPQHQSNATTLPG